MAIILHSGSYDRLQHGLHVAQTALALGREVRLFFTYWSLLYLRKNGSFSLYLDREASFYENILKGKTAEYFREQINDLIRQTKELGAKIYVCSNSMSLLNISRDELIEEVDRSMGLTTLLAAATEDQLLFI
ncbi:MAG: DsrE/DsrF/DrsH-like family protein [Thermodesulfobacteriota bacterium]